MNAKTAQVLLSTSLTLTAALFAHQAHATPWTFSTSGTIGSGYDLSGTFFGGVPNANLAGLNFTLVTTIDPTLQSPNSDGSTYIETYGDNAIPYSETVTINGVTRTFIGVTSIAETFLNIHGQLYPGTYTNNEAYQYQNGLTADTTYLYGSQYVEGISNLGLGLSFNQVWSYTPQSSDLRGTAFQLSGPDGNVYFDVDRDSDGGIGNLSNISINESNSSVPEPGSIALLGAALLGSVAVRRRRKQ